MTINTTPHVILWMTAGNQQAYFIGTYDECMETIACNLRQMNGIMLYELGQEFDVEKVETFTITRRPDGEKYCHVSINDRNKQ